MLPLEHSAILLTCIKVPFVIKIFVLSIFEWPFYTGFTVTSVLLYKNLERTIFEDVVCYKVACYIMCNECLTNQSFVTLCNML